MQLTGIYIKQARLNIRMMQMVILQQNFIKTTEVPFPYYLHITTNNSLTIFSSGWFNKGDLAKDPFSHIHVIALVFAGVYI